MKIPLRPHNSLLPCSVCGKNMELGVRNQNGYISYYVWCVVHTSNNEGVLQHSGYFLPPSIKTVRAWNEGQRR